MLHFFFLFIDEKSTNVITFAICFCFLLFRSTAKKLTIIFNLLASKFKDYTISTHPIKLIFFRNMYIPFESLEKSSKVVVWVFRDSHWRCSKKLSNETSTYKWKKMQATCLFKRNNLTAKQAWPSLIFRGPVRNLWRGPP